MWGGGVLTGGQAAAENRVVGGGTPGEERGCGVSKAKMGLGSRNFEGGD